MKTLLRVLHYLSPHRSLVVGTFLFAGLATAFELIPPWLIKVIIDDVIQAGQTQLLAWVFLGLCAAYVLREPLRVDADSVEQRAGAASRP